ncbi:Wzz/FepE/Etk N-terminal domain-containing protein [Marinobacter sp. chi1]|uniref:Wzz/FepE/Etk N-terminal domain-containing protein n=1 Tax=Marinobacter suaedae TaxID=3057675 RepID=A0ABT8W2X1_9GAMM|nr:XrtA system polysaccharide chain length determinant [Marinobacter sp. chi1]MDO3722593.1 Wzz/FepE/Etk N-terminal domain-containing protein [Marinobacter sp. chi1]
MDIQFILDMLRAVKLELYRHKFVVAIIFMLVTASVLSLGYIMPKTYTSRAVLYADQSNILQPLLRGKAEVTQIDRINEAREMLQSRTFLEQVSRDTGLITGGESDAVRNRKINTLRDDINIRVSNQNFLELSYTSESPEKSFKVLSAVLDWFVERTVQKKRSESQGAFQFIDSQVKSYQRQLEAAEQRLKEFKTANQDGTESSVLARIEKLRDEIESLKLEIQQTESEVQLTRRQLNHEEPVLRITVDPGKSAAEQQLVMMRQALDSALLKYSELHPDVINIRSQIADLENRISTETDDDREGSVVEVLENPVYENLKIHLSDSTTQLTVQKNRLASLERLLEDGYERSERVAENEAELAELTRDYDVTREVYEDMLQRREAARLSMTLDVQGEGVSYKIQEPASYPATWDGLQLHEIGLAGPFLGSAAVLGLLVMLVMFDQRVRSPRALQMAVPESISVLTTIPHYRSTWKDSLLRKDVLFTVILLTVFMAAYMAVLLFSVLGMAPEQLMEQVSVMAGFGSD